MHNNNNAIQPGEGMRDLLESCMPKREECWHEHIEIDPDRVKELGKGLQNLLSGIS